MLSILCPISILCRPSP